MLNIPWLPPPIHKVASYVSKDATLWIGGGSQGIFFCNLAKQKFQHYLNTGNDQKQINVTRIIPVDHQRYVIFTRRYGILLMNENGDVLHHWTQLPGGSSYFTSVAAASINDQNLIFAYERELYLLNLHSQKIIKLDHPQRYT